MRGNKDKKKLLLIPAMLDDTFDLLKYAFESERYHTVVLKNTEGVINTGLENLPLIFLIFCKFKKMRKLRHFRASYKNLIILISPNF